ncbi:PREDICTED: replication protein-like [Habropoda laboriosa]|uniref:replication protein-like n=1 Tax=Habropoda laboriosa TaxID=597456 RepID=UPI00083DF5A4|nr:PREDICTED: replication protein-like [Habropoda laboriosa]
MSQSCHDFNEEINFLSEISPNDLSWDQHRSNAEDIAVLYNRNIEFTKYADRINGCSGYLKFAVVESKLVLKEVWFCRVRHCPVCQWRRSLKMRAMMYKNIDRVIQQYPSHRWIFITLTVKNPHVKDLKDTLNLMNKGWQRFIQTKRFRSVVDGFIRTTEITRPKKKNEKMQVHPHFHAMLLVKSSYFARDYIKQTEWVEMWVKAMRLDYFPQVNVKAIKPNKKKTDQENKSKLHDAILETFKYSVKPSDMLAYDDQGEWLCQVTKQTHKMRFLATGGVLKGVLKEDATNQEMIAPDGDKEQLDGEDEAPRFGFSYVPKYRRYVYNPTFNAN